MNGHKLHYDVKFPIQNPVPRLKSLLYNGVEICLDKNNQNDKEDKAHKIKLSHTYSILNSNSPLVTSTSFILLR